MSLPSPRSELIRPETPLRRALGALGPVRRAVKSPTGQQAIAIVRAAHIVRPAVRLLRTRETWTYTLRGSAQRVTLRPRAADLIVLHEIFGRRVYEPPAEAIAALGDAPLASVLDLGANIGLFAVHAVWHHAAERVDAVEPDPSNADVLAETIAANGYGGRIVLHRAAAGTAPGEIAFAARGDIWSSAVPSSTPGAITVPVVDVFELAPSADLIKLDIEGAEWPILADGRLAGHPARALSLEWHAQGCPEADPRSLAEKLLVRAGFVVRHDPADLATCGTLWAWRPQ